MSEGSSPNNDAEKDFVKKLETRVQSKDQIDQNQEQLSDYVQKTTVEYEQLKSNIETASGTLGNAYWLLDFVSWIAPLGLVVWYYALYFYYGLPTGFAYEGLAIALPTALFLRILVWTLRMRLVGEDVSFIESLKDSIRGFMGNRFEIKFQNSKLTDQLSGVRKFTGLMLNAVRSYIPGLDQYYSSQQRIRGQRNFVQKLRNALVEYGFPIRGKVESYLAEFGPLADTEPEWVDIATKDMSIIYGISKSILKLVYADYSNDDAERKNAWNEIREDTKILHQFARCILYSGRIPTEYIEKDLESFGGIEELIVKTDPFNLNSFLSSYNIQYYQLMDEKEALIEAIRFYHLDISPTSEKEIKKYIPPSFKETERLGNLFLFSAARTTTQAEIIELIFYEYQGLSAERQKAWTYLKHSENSKASELDPANQFPSFPDAENTSENRNLLTSFVRLLLDRNLFDIPHDYLENTRGLNTYVLRILALQEDFALAQTRMKIVQSFASMDRHKDDMVRAMSSNNIPLDDEDRKIFLGLLPVTDVANPFDEDITWLADHAKVRKNILLLFYYDYTAKEKKRDNCFNDLKAGKNDEITILSQELLERNIISTEREEVAAKTDSKIANLAAYLKIAPKFERIKIESVFSRYERLFHYSKSILSYLKEQKICHEKSELSFEKLLSEITDTKTQALDQLRIMTVALVRDFNNMSIDKDWLEPVALASLIVYLVEHEDISLTNAACRRFANNAQCVEILYEYSWTNEDEQHKSQESKSPLAKVVDIAVQRSNSRVEYMPEFQRELKSHGYLPIRISDIPNVRLRHIGDQVDKVVSELEYKKKLDSHLQALGTVLESEFKAKTIIESLKMQLIAAYAITFPTGADVIGSIIDNRLLDVIEDLSRENPIYNQILSRDDIREASIGRWTRVGVVPYNMTFSDFSEHLQRAYRIAVDQYEKSGMMHHKLEDYVANVLRIFPTKTYFKQLEPFEKGPDSEDILADMLRPQILRKYGAIKTAEIMASLKTSVEEKIAMRSVLATLYDTSSALYMIAQKQFDGVLVSSPTLRDYITTGKFDSDLCSAFKQPQLSEFAMMIYRSAKGGGKGKEAINQKLEEEIKSICSAIRSRPSVGEVEGVSALVFTVLFDVGMILDGLSD